MKKQILCLLAALMLLLGLSVSASAYESAHVFDYAGLLTDSEAGALEARCQDAEDTYGCGVYIVTVDDYSLYYDAGPIENFSEGFFLDFVGFSEEILIGFFFSLCGFFLPISRMHNVVCFLRPQSDDSFACVAKPFDAMNVSGRGCSAELVNAGCKSFSCHTIRLNHTIITQ